MSTSGIRFLVVYSLLIVVSVGCMFNQPIHRRYYTLVQPLSDFKAEARFSEDLWIREVQIASVYDRPQIVFRYSPTELRYFNHDTWADRPQRMLGQHLVHSFRSFGLFRSVSERLGTSPPKYVLDTRVHAIEQLDGKDIWYAHLSMSFVLSKFGESEVLWEYSFSEQRPLHHQDVALTVRAVSEILEEEMLFVLAQVEATLAGKPLPVREGRHASDVSDTRPMSITVDRSEMSDGGIEYVRPSLLGDRSDSTFSWGTAKIDWRRSPHYTSDPTVVPPGKGAVFLPALSGEPDREPTVEVYKGDEVVARGFMGRRIPVDPGKYEVHFGSGPLSLRMVRNVEVAGQEVVIVEPDWAALEVSVVDERFISWRGSYEVNDQTRAEYVGLGYGADEEQGERAAVWVLRPGVYRIVQPGASYRTRTNFTTVQLPPAEAISFVLVIDQSSGDFLGAGISDHEEDAILGVDDRWSITSSVGGDFLWNSRSGYDADVGEELALTFYLDNLVRFRMDPHIWTTRLEVEESHRLLGRIQADGSRAGLFSGEFEPITDRVYANTLYIYELLDWAGPYARIGGESSLFYRYRNTGADQEVTIYDDLENIVETHPAGSLDRVRLARTFSPFEFKEGAGVNFRVFRRPNADLDLRVGFGGRQYLAFGQLLANEERSTSTNLVLDTASNSFLIGPEATIVASARPTRYLQGTSEFDALIPLGDRYSTRFTWRNSLSLRLSNFASLIYTLNLDQNPNVGREDPLLFDQALRLRFTFLIF